MISFSFGLHISSYFVKIHIEMSKIYKFLSTFIIFSYLYKQLCARFSGNSTFKYQLNNGKDEICFSYRSVKRYWKSRGFTTCQTGLLHNYQLLELSHIRKLKELRRMSCSLITTPKRLLS